MNKIIHYEIPVKDLKKSEEFYSKIFGWKTKVSGDENYQFVETENKEISIAFEKFELPNNYPIVYIKVDSVEETIKNISKSGGKILVSKTKYKNMGFYAVVTDPEGNHIGLWEKSK